MILEDRLQRIAFARLLSDLMEADSIIEESEIVYLDGLLEKYRITRDMFVEAKKRTFEWAVRTLRQAGDDEKEIIIESLRHLALSDGNCAPSEALLIIAVSSVLKNGAEAYSIQADQQYDDFKCFYIDSEDSSPVSDFLADHFRSIGNEFNMAGFEFVFIPQIAADYRLMAETSYLGKTISYMMPSLPERQIEIIISNLCSMTTPRFCRNILFEKYGINVLGTGPALLVKTGESSVVDNYHSLSWSNYLRIELDESPDRQILGVLDLYKGMVSSPLSLGSRSARSKFICNGYHRTLVDLLAYDNEQTEYRMVIDVGVRREAKVVLRPVGDSGNEVKLNLAPRALALYLLMVHQSLFDSGLFWQESSGRRKDELLSKYITVYSMVGNRDNPTEYKDRTLVSRIKKEFRSLKEIVTNVTLFMPELKIIGNKSFYSVPVPLNLVSVLEEGKELPMNESSFWSSI